jgi:glycosyltransferase involved in cell wall biosynthesis
MDSKPLFSVLIANYNNGCFIEEAIDSVLVQTYTDWEIIIVDDGSIDNSRAILEKYREDNRIKIYYNDKNRGCGYTKRKCVELADGELCGFLDPDDAITPDAIAIMVDLHMKKEDCSLIYSTCYVCNDISEILYIEDRVGTIPEDEDLLANSMKGIAPFAAFKKTI